MANGQGQRGVSEGHQEDTIYGGWHSTPTPYYKAQKIMGPVDKEIKARRIKRKPLPRKETPSQQREMWLDQGRQGKFQAQIVEEK